MSLSGYATSAFVRGRGVEVRDIDAVGIITIRGYATSTFVRDRGVGHSGIDAVGSLAMGDDPAEI